MEYKSYREQFFKEHPEIVKRLRTWPWNVIHSSREL